MADSGDNAAAHRRLVTHVEAVGSPWIPAVGASPDARHHELSVIVHGWPRADALALGAAHGQLVVFELDEEHLRVLPCDGGAPIVRGRWTPTAESSITFDDVLAWRAEHEVITRRLLPRVNCPACGAADPARIQRGLPVRMPPDWITLGGCIVNPGDPTYHCRACDHRW